MQDSGIVLDGVLCALLGLVYVFHLGVQYSHEDFLHYVDRLDYLPHARSQAILHYL